MSNIVRRDPFAVDDLFDDLFKGYFVRPVRFPRGEAAVQIKVDVREDDKVYTVHAEIPGVKKEDIHVNLEGSTVSISAEVKRESERKEGEKVIQSERYYGKVYRGFSLDHEVDEAASKARFENGVLELTLPKKAVTSARRVTVE